MQVRFVVLRQSNSALSEGGLVSCVCFGWKADISGDRFPCIQERPRCRIAAIASAHVKGSNARPETLHRTATRSWVFTKVGSPQCFCGRGPTRYQMLVRCMSGESRQNWMNIHDLFCVLQFRKPPFSAV
jgi:hypothetical protein